MEQVGLGGAGVGCLISLQERYKNVPFHRIDIVIIKKQTFLGEINVPYCAIHELVLTIGLSFGMAVLGLLVQPTVKIARRQQPQQQPQQQQQIEQQQQQIEQQQRKPEQQQHNTELENEDIAFFQFAGFCTHQIPPIIIHLYHQSG
jgi:hypothetical protein